MDKFLYTVWVDHFKEAFKHHTGIAYSRAVGKDWKFYLGRLYASTDGRHPTRCGTHQAEIFLASLCKPNQAPQTAKKRKKKPAWKPVGANEHPLLDKSEVDVNFRWRDKKPVLKLDGKYR